MTAIKTTWAVPASGIATVMASYDQVKVYVADDPLTPAGPATEVTGVGTRVTLRADQAAYYFDHVGGETVDFYRYAFYNSVTLAEGAMSTPLQYPEAGAYATVAAVRAAGIPAVASGGPADVDVAKTLRDVSTFIDRGCRQWFEPRALNTKVDGNDSRILWFAVPIIVVTEFYLNAIWSAALDSDLYEVYNNLGDGLKDDRRNPKVAMSDYGSLSLYRRALSTGLFEAGTRNQQLVGVFGFVEPDGAAPPLIARAVVKLAVARHGASDGLTPDPVPSGPVVSETTDGHTIRYASTVGGRRLGTVGITSDPEVEAIILQYRAPKGIAVV